MSILMDLATWYKPVELEVSLEFESRPETVRTAVVTLFSLPADLRPTHRSEAEDDPGERILDGAAYAATLSDPRARPYLRGAHGTYSFRSGEGGSVVCTAFLRVPAGRMPEYLRHMAAAGPIFGYACLPEEYKKRNRVMKDLRTCTVESWVGRNLQTYLSGFYWLTLISEGLAEKHGIPLASVQAAAREHVAVGQGLHLFRFYHRPQGWRYTRRVSRLIASLPGVFDVRRIRRQVAAAGDMRVLDEVLLRWV
jgi:hypothetical protein